MRPFWLTGWLLASLLVCSAADPRLAAAGAPAPAPAQTKPEPRKTPADGREVHAAIALTGSARAQKIDELSAGWTRRKQLLQEADAAYEHALAAKQQFHRSAVQPKTLAWFCLASRPPSTSEHLRLELLTTAALPCTEPAGVPLAVQWLARAQGSRAAPHRQA